MLSLQTIRFYKGVYSKIKDNIQNKKNSIDSDSRCMMDEIKKSIVSG